MKKVLSVLLAALMLFSCFSAVTAFAADPVCTHSDETKIHTRTITEATCKAYGKAVRHCTACGKDIGEPFEIEKLEHNWVIVEGSSSEPTCTKEGSTSSKQCTICKEIQKGTTLSKRNHVDKDGDNKCDLCKNFVIKNDSGFIKDVCTCACHSDNTATKLIFNIINFFFKLLKINPTCKCGTAHY